MKETKKRSIAKSISWRIISVIGTLIIIYSFTGEIFTSSAITMVGAGYGFTAHYLHERGWSKVAWGYLDG